MDDREKRRGGRKGRGGNKIVTIHQKELKNTCMGHMEVEIHDIYMIWEY